MTKSWIILFIVYTLSKVAGPWKVKLKQEESLFAVKWDLR